MTEQNWADPLARSVALLIDGSTDPDVDANCTPPLDDDFLVLVNACWQPLTFTVPADVSRRWDIACDTFEPAHTDTVDARLEVGPRSIVALRCCGR